MRMSELTWCQVKAYLEKRTSLILPLGTCEQHGRHLPLSTDMIIAQGLAERVGNDTGVALAAAIPYGVNLPCDRFMYGTAGFSLDSFRRAVGEVLSDWRRQGFRRFYLITAHGCAMGNFGFAHHEALKEACAPLLLEDGVETYLIFPYWVDISDLLDREKHAEHAGEVETSLIMYLRPDLVNTAEIVDTPAVHEESTFDVFPEGIQREFPEPGFSGGEGYPSSASREKGERIFSRLVQKIGEFVREKEEAGGENHPGSRKEP